MKIVALYNVKGGVGKTSTTVNLSYLAADEGYKTVLWDLDPQGAATFYLNALDRVKGKIKKIITDKDFYKNNIHPTDYKNLYILPSDLDLRNIDIIFNDIKKSTKKFKESIEDGFGSFDLVFVDCPPGISLLSEHIIEISDLILSPLIPSPLSLRTYELLNQFSKDKIVRGFFSMVDKRKKLHRQIIDDLIKGENFLKNVIPYSSKVEQMGTLRKPLPSYDNSDTAENYMNLWNEVKDLLNLNK